MVNGDFRVLILNKTSGKSQDMTRSQDSVLVFLSWTCAYSVDLHCLETKTVFQDGICNQSVYLQCDRQTSAAVSLFCCHSVSIAAKIVNHTRIVEESPRLCRCVVT